MSMPRKVYHVKTPLDLRYSQGPLWVAFNEAIWRGMYIAIKMIVQDRMNEGLITEQGIYLTTHDLGWITGATTKAARLRKCSEFLDLVEWDYETRPERGSIYLESWGRE